MSGDKLPRSEGRKAEPSKGEGRAIVGWSEEDSRRGNWREEERDRKEHRGKDGGTWKEGVAEEWFHYEYADIAGTGEEEWTVSRVSVIFHGQYGGTGATHMATDPLILCRSSMPRIKVRL